MEKKTVYLETSVVRYLANRPSRALVVADCKHIANAERFDAIASACLESGYKPPIICTPDELTGD